jgi:hypothetical protein
MLDLQSKEFAQAVSLFQQAIAGVNGLRQKDGANREYKTEAATYYINLTLALASEHQFALAAQSDDSARQITDELAAPSPALQILQTKVIKLQSNAIKLQVWIAAHK